MFSHPRQLSFPALLFRLTETEENFPDREDGTQVVSSRPALVRCMIPGSRSHRSVMIPRLRVFSLLHVFLLPNILSMQSQQ
jgi:hypothetical protein